MIQRWLRAPTLLCLALLVAVQGTATASEAEGFLGLYADAAGNVAHATARQGESDTLFVLARIRGGDSSLISGAEFRIDITRPQGWFFIFEPTDDGLTVGSPFAAAGDSGAGVSIALPNCISAKLEAPAVLGRIIAFNDTASSTQLLVRRHSKSINPKSHCALLTRCNRPFFDILCVSPSDTTAIARNAPPDDPVLFVAQLHAGP